MQAGKTVQDKGEVDPTDLLVIAELTTNYLAASINIVNFFTMPPTSTERQLELAAALPLCGLPVKNNCIVLWFYWWLNQKASKTGFSTKQN